MSKLGTLDLDDLIDNALDYNSHNSAWSSYIESDEESSFIVKADTPLNPNIIFKPLDTFIDKKQKQVPENALSGQSHLLNPFVHEDMRRMDTGNSSNDWLKSMQEGTVENLLLKQYPERQNTPGYSDVNKLFEKKAGIKKSSTKLDFKELINQNKKPRRLVPSKQKHDFLRKATISIKKYEKKHPKVDYRINRKLKEKAELYQKQLMMLIESGDFSKISDLLTKANITLEVRDSDGNTPLNIASQNGCYEIVQILTKYGA